MPFRASLAGGHQQISMDLNPGSVRKAVAEDPEELVANMSGVQLEIALRSRAQRPWKVLQLDLLHARLVWGQFGASVSITAAADPDATSYSLVSRNAAWTINGVAPRREAITRVAPRADYAVFTAAPMRWITLRVEERFLLERYPSVARRATSYAPLQLLTPRTQHARELRDAFNAALDLVTRRPEDLPEAAVLAHIEDRLMGALVKSLEGARFGESGRHAAILGKLRLFFESQPELPLRVGDLCRHLGASQRSLHRVFVELYGISPARYLRLRRLHQARRALRWKNGAQGSVTEVGTAMGFFDLGRFASEYRALFGELPSETLRRRARACAA